MSGTEYQTDGPKEPTTEEIAARLVAARDALTGEQLVNRPLDRDFIVQTLGTLTEAVHHLFSAVAGPVSDYSAAPTSEETHS